MNASEYPNFQNFRVVNDRFSIHKSNKILLIIVVGDGIVFRNPSKIILLFDINIK